MRLKHPRIHLYEPNELLGGWLRKAFGGNKNIVVHGFGLGDETGEGVLVVPVYKRWLFDGLGSFDEAEAGNWLKTRIFFFNERLLTLRRSRSHIRRLDDLGLAPFFIKLDIQGYEYKALKGGEQTIALHEPVLLIESPNDSLVAYLGGLGFQPYAFEAGRFRRGKRGAPNTFFMTSSKAALVWSHIDGSCAA
jgi:FkbM family methyltransferase